jgi:hypothetical protein
MIKSRVDAGQVGTDELVKREGELRVLQQKLVEAQANLELLERVRSVVRPELEDQAEKTDQPDQSDETDQTDP